MSYAIDRVGNYRVYDGEDKPLRLMNEDTALQYAVECNAEKVVFRDPQNGAEILVSVSISLLWLKEQPEVPAILPDFIKRHIPASAIEDKRNQQLGRV